MMTSSKPSPLTSPAEDTEAAGRIARVLAMDDEAAGPGGYIHQIDRHALCSASLVKLREVTATLARAGWCAEVAAGLREQAGTRVKAAVTG